MKIFRKKKKKDEKDKKDKKDKKKIKDGKKKKERNNDNNNIPVNSNNIISFSNIKNSKERKIILPVIEGHENLNQVLEFEELENGEGLRVKVITTAVKKNIDSMSNLPKKNNSPPVYNSRNPRRPILAPPSSQQANSNPLHLPPQSNILPNISGENNYNNNNNLNLAKQKEQNQLRIAIEASKKEYLNTKKKIDMENKMIQDAIKESLGSNKNKVNNSSSEDEELKKVLELSLKESLRFELEKKKEEDELRRILNSSKQFKEEQEFVLNKSSEINIVENSNNFENNEVDEIDDGIDDENNYENSDSKHEELIETLFDKKGIDEPEIITLFEKKLNSDSDSSDLDLDLDSDGDSGKEKVETLFGNKKKKKDSKKSKSKKKKKNRYKNNLKPLLFKKEKIVLEKDEIPKRKILFIKDEDEDETFDF